MLLCHRDVQVPIMVGYMRRYAEAFCVFKKMVQELKSIDYARVSSCLH